MFVLAGAACDQQRKNLPTRQHQARQRGVEFKCLLTCCHLLLLFALQALHVINSVKTDPCGNIRRVNVEIPTLSVSDMRRLKATDCVSTMDSSSDQ
jgi:hypothetical protein